jgi:hypothetical protein
VITTTEDYLIHKTLFTSITGTNHLIWLWSQLSKIIHLNKLRLWTPLVRLNVVICNSDRYWMKWLKKYTLLVTTCSMISTPETPKSSPTNELRPTVGCRVQIYRNKRKNHWERLWSSTNRQTVKNTRMISFQSLFRRLIQNNMSVTYVWM